MSQQSPEINLQNTAQNLISGSQKYSPTIYKPHKIDRRKKGTFWRHMLAGGVSGAVSRTVVAPIERVKIILQTQNLFRVAEHEKYKGFFDAIMRIPKEQGFLSLWRGNGTNVLRIAPNIAMRFAVYDKFKSYFIQKENNQSEVKKVFYHVLCGLSSGVLTMAVNYPFDVIRVRLSVDMTTKESVINNKRQYNGFMDCFKKMIKNEGLKSLYQGYTFSLLGLAPYLAISFSTYDFLKNLYNINTIDPNDQSNMMAQIITYMGIGSVAGGVAQLITQPLDVIRRRLQVNGGVNHERLYKGGIDCIKKTIRNEGIKGLYIGVVPNLIKIVPAASIQFTVFDTFKNFVFE
ncbi:Mitochondrial carrier domain [Pseudocohnilembus persalinus]|uniref:Mitochondrial carrier domain n=1 Tax=Pseudocohnilembus persalinus TaxID=266149 RepID=A0A0V0Q8K2_PSEPJ|nr:Mitochondrial carrier domain [Pseudocohnilembus persalinus]|eukprot:KRW98526.1 Mitochondrial carrier domain [Pseudocohnilembus persalinus]